MLVLLFDCVELLLLLAIVVLELISLLFEAEYREPLLELLELLEGIIERRLENPLEAVWCSAFWSWVGDDDEMGEDRWLLSWCSRSLF